MIRSIVLPVGLSLLLMGLLYCGSIIFKGVYYAYFSGILIASFYIWLFYIFERDMVGKQKYHWLILIIYMIVILVLACLFSLAFYFTGQGIVKESSFGQMIYYGIISLTSVGYGDLSPHTEIDRILSSFMAIIGSMHMIVFISSLLNKLKSS